MSQGPKSQTAEETQTAPRDEKRNDQAEATGNSAETGADTGVTVEAEPEKIVDQMSNADYPSSGGRVDDPGV